MRGLSLGWTVALALYLLRGLSLWVVAAKQVKDNRTLSPRRRRSELRIVRLTAISWPFLTLGELVVIAWRRVRGVA